MAEAEGVTPLEVAIRARDLATVRRLLEGGANPRVGGADLPLHLAARLGPLELVETLIAGGALVWQRDGAGRTALDAARSGEAEDRPAIVALLDRERIDDPIFRAGVAAILAGDASALARLLEEHPDLLRLRNVGPEVYRRAERDDYFRDPKLFWYVANNPASATPMPPNMVAIATLMIERGVERDDLDYTLELVMSSSSSRESALQLPLMRLLRKSGAAVTRRAVIVAAAHGELDAVRELLDSGTPMSAPIAAALGDAASLEAQLTTSARSDVQDAFALAVINGRVECARLALDAGADPNVGLPVHAHSTALHQAAAADRADIIALLLERGARGDVRDTLWSATPLEWARFAGCSAAETALAGA